MSFAAWMTCFVRRREEAALAARGGARAPPGAPSPFGGVSATANWQALALVHKLWVEQADISPGRRDGAKDWAMQHAATRLLRELLGALDLAERAGTDDDRHTAERLARRCACMHAHARARMGPSLVAPLQQCPSSTTLFPAPCAHPARNTHTARSF